VPGLAPLPAEPEEPPALQPRTEAPALLRATALGWIGIGLLIVCEWGLFRQFAQREITWAYPANYDQVQYLSQSYRTYQQMLDQGVGPGLWYALDMTVPQGMLIHPQAALLFFVVGPSRLGALTLNFLYFAALQVVLVGTLRWLTRSWAVPALGLGLLLTAATAWYWAGGLMDFRLDFIAFCLFGIFICTVVRSGIFASPAWSLMTGGVAAWLVLFRFITSVYILVIFAGMGLFLYARSRTGRGPNRGPAMSRLRGLLTAVIVLVALTAPALWHARDSLRRYYVVGHVTGEEKAIRAEQLGLHGLADVLSFYPRSILSDHAGPTFLRFAAVALGLTFLLALAAPRSTLGAEPPRLDLPTAYAFLTACLLGPVAVLTANTAKSPVVGNVVVPALLWLVVLTVAVWSGALRRQALPPITSAGLAVVAALAVACGIATQFVWLAQRSDLSRRRADVEQVLQLYDVLIRHSLQRGLDRPVVSADIISDYVNPTIVEPLAYERHGISIRPRGGPALGRGVFAMTKDGAVPRLEQSDFFITAGSDTARDTDFPFDRSMRRLRPELQGVRDRTFVELRRFRIYDRDVTLYANVRGALAMEGDSGGWITSDGLTLVGYGRILQVRPHIEMRGKTAFEWLGGRVPLVRAELRRPDSPPENMPAALTAIGPAYTLTLDLDPKEIEPEAMVRVRLLFDSYFVPKDIGLNADTRRLVIRTPTEIEVQPPRTEEKPSRPVAAPAPRRGKRAAEKSLPRELRGMRN